MTIELFEFVYWKKVADPQAEECHRNNRPLSRLLN